MSSHGAKKRLPLVLFLLLLFLCVSSGGQFGLVAVIHERILWCVVCCAPWLFLSVVSSEGTTFW